MQPGETPEEVCQHQGMKMILVDDKIEDKIIRTILTSRTHIEKWYRFKSIDERSSECPNFLKVKRSATQEKRFCSSMLDAYLAICESTESTNASNASAGNSSLSTPNVVLIIVIVVIICVLTALGLTYKLSPPHVNVST